MNVLITGAASGIGYKLTQKLVREGHYVYLCVHNKEEVLTTVQKVEQSDYLDRISVIKLDITKKKDRELITKLDIDCLVNLAAIGVGGSILDLPMSKVKENFEVNFFSTLELTKLYINTRGNMPGRVVITSSLAGLITIPFLGSYCSSKAALISMSEALHKELKKTKYSIKLKLIEPGAYFTGFNEYMIENKDKLNNSIYTEDMTSIIDNQKMLFRFIEKKNLRSIVNKMSEAITKDSNKFIYKAPFFQKIMCKLYLLVFK